MARNKPSLLERLRAKKLPVQAEALVEWCRLHDKPCDSSARAAYVTEMAQARLNTASD